MALNWFPAPEKAWELIAGVIAVLNENDAISQRLNQVELWHQIEKNLLDL